MQFGDKVSKNVSLEEVYLNEAFIDTLKNAGRKVKDTVKKVWKALKGVIKNAAGYIVPVDADGNEASQFINIPANLAVMPLPASISFIPSEATLELCNNFGVEPRNAHDIESGFAKSIRDEKEEIENYWTRVIREYAQPENESLTLKETVKLVNEKYYHSTVSDKVLNETVVSLGSPTPGMYGVELGTDELVGQIITNIQHQLNPVSREDVKPALIWGAPGIGKTTIIKQAARMIKDEYKTRLDTVVVSCGALKPDDFELPDTVRNAAGEKMAVSTPKVWLPVFDHNGMTESEVAEADAYYNSGAYRIRRKSAGEESVKVDINSTGFDGGILFFDEFGRIRDIKTMDIMLNLCGDRIYADMKLASKWVMIAAANRLSDDAKSEADVSYWYTQDAAKLSRFEHYTYVPTLSEWLTWAREEDKTTGTQNVDELICKFIEKGGEKVWYDALKFGSREIESPEIKQIVNDEWGSESITADQIKAVGTYQSNPGKALGNMSRNTWNGRTWDVVIGKTILSVLKNELFFNQPEKYEACFSKTERIRDINGGWEQEKYSVKNLDRAKLAKQLDSIDTTTWAKWTARNYKRLDPSQQLRKNDRYGYFEKYIGSVIEDACGVGSVPAKAWEQYISIDTKISDDSIRYIYERGQLKTAQERREDDVEFSHIGDYNQISMCKWKADVTSVDEVASMVIDAFDQYITADILRADTKRIAKALAAAGVINNTLPAATKQAVAAFGVNADRFPAPADENIDLNVPDLIKNEQVDHYTIRMLNQDYKISRTIDSLTDPTCARMEGLEEKNAFILQHSEVARRLANMAMWISKISIQVGSNSALIAAMGNDIDKHTMVKGSILDRCSQLLGDNADLMNFYTTPNVGQKFPFWSPAYTIFNQMKQYS